jgi:hypothetical protein
MATPDNPAFRPVPRAPLAPFDGTLPYFPDGVPPGWKAPEEAPITLPKTILFAWELGAGFGHMMQMLPLARDLASAGHRVLVALAFLDRAASVFGEAGVRFLQAPVCRAFARIHPITLTFPQLLANVGWASPTQIFPRACAWRNLFKMARPDLAFFDHAPTALLASRGLPMKRALIGSGFCCPPDVTIGGLWGVLRPEAAKQAPAGKLELCQDELLQRMNHVLDKWKQPPMARLGQLYADVDENFLTSFPELDHFPWRTGAAYWGQVMSGGGEAPCWPEGKGKRVFAYLKPFKGIEAVLEELKRRKCRTILYVDGAPKGIDEHLSPILTRAKSRLDMQRIGKECDLAILNVGHGATAQILLSGKPILQIPLALEQRLVAEATIRAGAGVVGSFSRAESMGEALDGLLEGG